mgnify:CR=1 FL=1
MVQKPEPATRYIKKSPDKCEIVGKAFIRGLNNPKTHVEHALRLTKIFIYRQKNRILVKTIVWCKHKIKHPLTYNL